MGAFDIQGKNCVFQLRIDDAYKTVVCAKSFTFNPVTDMKETTTVGSGFWKEFRPRKLSYTITFNGMFQIESASNQEKIKTFFDYQTQFLPVPYRLIYTDNSGNVMVVDGWVYVTSSLFDASPVNLVNGTIELQGNGMPVLSDVIPDLVNINIVSAGDNSIVGKFQFKLFNTAGAVVFDSGQLPGASGGNLTHPVNVNGTVQKGTYSIFWQGDVQSIGNAFQLDAPPTKSAVFDNTISNESTYGVQEYDFTANRTVTFTLGIPAPPPQCVAPAFLTDLNNPAATVGTPWTGTITLSGSAPFSLSDITKPAWLDIVLSGNTITCSGNPEAGIDQLIQFNVNNACGTTLYSDTIDVSSNPDGVTIEFNYSESGPHAPVSLMRIYVNAVLFYVMSANGASNTVIVNPGDVVEIQVVGTLTSVTKHIDVTGTIDGEIINADSTLATLIRSFTAVIGNDYVVNGSAVG